MSGHDCCLKGFRWQGEPKGYESTLAGNKCYVTGTDPHASIMVIHDLFGWTFPNLRLLADHYAEEVGATVYLPDFFGGEVLPVDTILDKTRWAELNLPAFIQERNSKEIREPEIVAFAQAMRTKHQRVGAIGFCYGGWAVFRLGSASRNNGSTQLVDCISTAHPTFLEKEEISNVAVPVQILAPEVDPVFTQELKDFANTTIPTSGVPYDYQYFPGVEHSFATRGDLENKTEMRALERGKRAAAGWFREWLKDG